MHPRSLLPLLSVAAVTSCFDGTRTARTCADRVGEALAACPAGSDPSLDAKALADCSATAEGRYDPIEVNGSVQAACTSFGECVVKCSFAIPCPCGVASVTRDRIDCRECAACGNGECEPGEDRPGETGYCRQDCEASCVVGAERCNGQHRETCNVRAEWETLACSTGSTCRELDAGRTECRPTGSCTCGGVSECCDGCLARNVAQACDDGLYCQVGSTCSPDGLCGGSEPRDCQAVVTAPACQAPSCDEQLKTCVARPINEGGACENVATPAGDHCAAGTCVQDGCECAGESTCCDGCRPRNLGATCDDGLFCTAGDVCAAGGRCEGPRRDCSAVGTSACQRGECDETQDACVARAQKIGESCDDGLHCTSGTFCLPDGSCGGGGPTECGAVVSSAECQTAACDEAQGGCIARPKNVGQPCDDGLFCFEGSSCQPDGTCAGGAARDCMAALTAPDCQQNPRCDEADDVCRVEPMNAGRPCDDGLLCTTGETCDAQGHCGRGESFDCVGEVALGVCEVPVCDKTVDACATAPAPDGTTCDDDDPCTLNDACAAGRCAGRTARACPESACAQAGACNPASGACESAPKPDGTACAGGPNARAECQSGSCLDVGCQAGFDDCDPAAAGCETDVRADLQNCGACGTSCRAGGRFRNAKVSCSEGECAFGGCQVGFADADGDCEAGGPCATGCEVCSPLADGSIDIPDDGADEDCSGADSTNTEALGLYADAAFAPAGTAPCGTTPRGRRACPYTSLFDAALDMDAQDWTSPNAAKRYLYVAAGDYTDPGTVIETSRPTVVVGGYRRTTSGPWTRDGGATIVRSTTPNATAAYLAPSAGWAALDGLHVGPALAFSGRVLLRGLGEAAGPTLVRAAASPLPTTLQLFSATTGAIEHDVNQSCTPPNGLCPGWRLAQVNARGSLRLPPQASVVDSTVQGGIATAGYAVDDSAQPPLDLRRLQVNGIAQGTSHSLSSYGTPVLAEDSTFADHVSVSNWVSSRLLRSRVRGHLTSFRGEVAETEVLGVNNPANGYDRSYLQRGSSASETRWDGPVESEEDVSVVSSVFEGSLDLRAEPWSASRFVNNVVRGALTIRYGAIRVTGNLLLGGVTLVGGRAVEDSLVFDHNTVLRPSAAAAALRLEGTHVTVVNNLIVAGPLAPSVVHGIRETATDTDPTALLHNAFVGFDGVTSFPYLDEDSTPIADVRRLNTMASLEACARAGNVAFASDAAAGLLTSDPQQPDVGRIVSGPLVDAGLALPYSCSSWTIAAEATADVGGGPRLCGPRPDIGAYERCP